ncbi:MAG: hypothetical protein C0407_19035 [Desulfobacca sp.]|nr:hypothetical protein [Desulfobacca sp.]
MLNPKTGSTATRTSATRRNRRLKKKSPRIGIQAFLFLIGFWWGSLILFQSKPNKPGVERGNVW